MNGSFSINRSTTNPVLWGSESPTTGTLLNVITLINKNMNTCALHICVLKKSHPFYLGMCGEYHHLPNTSLSSVWHLHIKQPTWSRLCMPVLDTISWSCFIYWYRCHLEISPGETVYWSYRVAGIVWLLLLIGMICDRQSYRVKFFLREMANISPYQNTLRK